MLNGHGNGSIGKVDGDWKEIGNGNGKKRDELAKMEKQNERSKWQNGKIMAR